MFIWADTIYLLRWNSATFSDITSTRFHCNAIIIFYFKLKNSMIIIIVDIIIDKIWNLRE